MRGLRDGSAVERPSADEELSLYELAFLAGGAWRVAETVLLRMVLTNRLEMDRNGMLRVIRPRPRDEVEAVLLAAVGPSGTAWFGRPRAAFGSSAPAAELEAALRRRGLLVGGQWTSGRPETSGRPGTSGVAGARGASKARRSPEALARLAVPALVTVALTAVAVLTGRAAVVLLGADRGPAVILGGIAALLVAALPARRHRRRQETGENGDVRRPSYRARRLLTALEAGAAVPPGWRLAEEALAPVGRSCWSAVAVVGVEALGRDRLTAAVRGSWAVPARRPRPRPERPERRGQPGRPERPADTSPVDRTS
ncbi:TIGR04222 domain-containing membrane protein [Kitasatospora sp. NPDC127111]|uniref:TIGR04222 domain-containing membrane protein n=1 Tax=Kitasatospora sp. NPDC127111 TaxID=3345363 RepID=UPI00362616EA